MQNKLHKEIYRTKDVKIETFSVEQIAHKAIFEQFGRSSLKNKTSEE